MPADYRARGTRGRVGRGEQRREGFAVRKIILVANPSIAFAAFNEPEINSEKGGTGRAVDAYCGPHALGALAWLLT